MVSSFDCKTFLTDYGWKFRLKKFDRLWLVVSTKKSNNTLGRMFFSEINNTSLPMFRPDFATDRKKNYVN
jgi:hypothetical protein